MQAQKQLNWTGLEMRLGCRHLPSMFKAPARPNETKTTKCTLHQGGEREVEVQNPAGWTAATLCAVPWPPSLQSSRALWIQGSDWHRLHGHGKGGSPNPCQYFDISGFDLSKHPSGKPFWLLGSLLANVLAVTQTDAPSAGCIDGGDVYYRMRVRGPQAVLKL